MQGLKPVPIGCLPARLKPCPDTGVLRGKRSNPTQAKTRLEWGTRHPVGAGGRNLRRRMRRKPRRDPSADGLRMTRLEGLDGNVNGDSHFFRIWVLRAEMDRRKSLITGRLVNDQIICECGFTFWRFFVRRRREGCKWLILHEIKCEFGFALMRVRGELPGSCFISVI